MLRQEGGGFGGDSLRHGLVVSWWGGWVAAGGDDKWRCFLW